jgi:hypothetical protein
MLFKTLAMKQLLLFTIAALLVLSCRKKNSQKEAELPPETQTGAYTFGCKVDGKVFVPKDGRGKPGLFAQYVNLGNGPGGGWYLNIPAINWKDSPIEGISITTDSLLLIEGRNYNFKNMKGSVQAFYSKTIEYQKRDNESGSLHITKFDQSKRILSGTFSFVGTSSNGEKVNVTDGRFDIVY